jgi:hypothetical protein
MSNTGRFCCHRQAINNESAQKIQYRDTAFAVRSSASRSDLGENVERRSPGWRPGRRPSIYVAYWASRWSVWSLLTSLLAGEGLAGGLEG